MPEIYKYFFIILGIAVVMAIANILLKKKIEYPYKARKLLSNAEKLFFETLRECVPSGYMLFAKVKLSDIIESTINSKREYLNRINQKHIDFLLVDKAYKPALALELDDKSHDLPSRMSRDDFIDKSLGAAGIKIIHIKAASYYNSSDLTKLISETIE